ncbi:Protein Jumonji [Triplophysa tibetana]|uniref:Protein Jumonji n=1 Tax=Triplophysa tibetana TaxID=1572043 RepID=A0A5A9N2W6_9TELE|nr:Protein Jumonji [Triplophysa tibetana]
MNKQRPKRNIIQKKFDDNDGIPWSEERVVRRVLYLSLKEFKRAQKRKVESSTGMVNGSFANGHLNGVGSKAGMYAGSCKSDRIQHTTQGKDCSHEYSIDEPVRKSAMRTLTVTVLCLPNQTHKDGHKMLILVDICSAALPSNIAYFGSSKDEADVDEDEEEEEDSVCSASASCTSTPRKRRGPSKCNANGYVFNGQMRAAVEQESSLRAKGKEGIQGKEKNSTTLARSSTTHNLRPSRSVQEKKQQSSKINGTSRTSAVPSKKKRELRTPPTKAVKNPKGHVTYTKARLLKEAKLSLSAHERQLSSQHTNPQHSNSGKAQTSHAKMQKQVLSPASTRRLSQTDSSPPRRNGLRQSKRQLESSLSRAEVEVKKIKLQVLPLNTRSRKAAQETPAPGSHAKRSRAQAAGSQRPKRTTAGKLMITKQKHCKATVQAKNSPTTSTQDIIKPANPPKTNSSVKQISPEPLDPAEPKEQGRRGTVTETMAVTEVPVFHPGTKEFHDPLAYMEFVQQQAEPFGLYRVVPPAGWRPECKLKEEMRFVSYVQHVHKLGRRWGPNVQQLACIRKHLRTQGINIEEPPLIGGCELDLARFFQLLNDMGGMQQVTDLKTWGRLADLLGIPRSAQDRLAKLQEAYCQYLLSYDSLSPMKRSQLEKEVLTEKQSLERRSGPLEGQGDISQHAALLLPRCEPKNGLVNGALHKSGTREHLRELDPTAKSSRLRRLEKRGGDEGVLSEPYKCIYRGKSFSLTTFFRAARNTMNMCFSKEPDTAEVEISPEVLRQKGVKVYRTVQQSGQFMVCFPGTFVSKVCCGYSVSETVHFANPQWMKLGYEAAKDLKRRQIEEPFSTEKLIYQIATSERDNKQLLNGISVLIKELRDAEISQRRDLFEAGLRLSARYGTQCESPTEKKKQQRSRFPDDTADRRCHACQHLCYLSMVVHESDNVVFCLECALRYIQKRRSPRGLKMMFRYSEEQINSLVNGVCGKALERGGDKPKADGKTPAKRSPRNKSSARVTLSCSSRSARS